MRHGRDITQRSRLTVENYAGDLRSARSLTEHPPSLGQLVEHLWRHPLVLANSAALKILMKAYAVMAIPVVIALYALVWAQLHPARAAVVDSLIVAAIWMWFFS